MAHVAATARHPALPRLWRITLTERTQAFGLVLLLFLGEHECLTPEQFVEGERCFERLTGLHLARKAVGRKEPWLTGHSLDHFSEVASLPVLRAKALTADEAQLRAAAQSAHRVHRLFPVAALIVEGWDPRRGRGGMEAFLDLDLGGPTGEALWLSYFLSIQQSSLAGNLEEIERALEPLDDLAKVIFGIAQRPADLIRRRLVRLPSESRRVVERTLELARSRS